MEDNWQRVYYSDQMHRAGIVHAILTENNIKSVLIDKRDSSYIAVGDIEVYVRPEDAILARLIIEQNNL